jgi:geranylgeranyl pyrophosphate synthase
MPCKKNKSNNFDIELARMQRIVNSVLTAILREDRKIEKTLNGAIRYMLLDGGKRIRPAIVMWCCRLVSGKINHDAQIAAAAIEMMHTSSLIHDDLPAMDDDDMRRGKPSCHKKFDEATAILTGDALLILAFEILAKKISNPAVAVQLVGELAEAAGPAGMIAGQMADLKAEKIKGTKQIVEYIHINKTARMFRAAAAMGAICGHASEKHKNLLCKYGIKLGLTFQITDDILDVCSSTRQLGKTAGKDVKAGKATYPAVIGIEKSRAKARLLTSQAVAALEPFGKKTDALRRLAHILQERVK